MLGIVQRVGARISRALWRPWRTSEDGIVPVFRDSVYRMVRASVLMTDDDWSAIEAGARDAVETLVRRYLRSELTPADLVVESTRLFRAAHDLRCRGLVVTAPTLRSS